MRIVPFDVLGHKNGRENPELGISLGMKVSQVEPGEAVALNAGVLLTKVEDKDGECRIIRQFGYQDFEMRL